MTRKTMTQNINSYDFALHQFKIMQSRQYGLAGYYNSPEMRAEYYPYRLIACKAALRARREERQKGA